MKKHKDQNLLNLCSLPFHVNKDKARLEREIKSSLYSLISRLKTDGEASYTKEEYKEAFPYLDQMNLYRRLLPYDLHISFENKDDVLLINTLEAE